MEMETKKKTKVSIIMAAYNAEKTIGESIMSVINQTYTEWELVIVNDSSTDNTVKIVNSFNDPRIHLINNESNCGVSLTRKKGAEFATGDWIAVLDSDDQWINVKLEKQIELAEREGVELGFTGSSFVKENGESVDWELHVPESLTFKQLLKQNLISNSSALVKRNLYLKYYAIGDNMHEDFALWLGITKSGVIAHGIDEPLLIYRLSQNSKSGNKLKSARMNWNTYRYVGLGIFKSFYYMLNYMWNGIMKYKHLK